MQSGVVDFSFRLLGLSMTVGLVCGTFDLCHAGHVCLLQEAKRICDRLIVGLQEDPSLEEDSIYRIATRGSVKVKPILTVEERSIILRELRCVDDLFVYRSEASLVEWLRRHPVDVRIFGEDWRGKPYTGQELGHAVHFVVLASYNEGIISSTDIRRRVLVAKSTNRIGREGT